jgi:hypothetical protein
MNRINWCHAVGQAEELDRTTKAVAWAIGAHMNAAGEANPSQDRIAAYSSSSVSTVKRALRKLSPGFLRVEHVDGRPSRYLATVPTQANEIDPGVVHPYGPATQFKSRSRFRKTQPTQMTYEIQKSQSNGTASTEDEAIRRWLNAGGRDLTDSQAIAHIAQQWCVPRLQARMLVNAHRAPH